MKFDQWANTHVGDRELLKDCWDKAQAAMKTQIKQKLGDNYGFVGGRFYYKMSDIVKELT